MKTLKVTACQRCDEKHEVEDKDWWKRHEAACRLRREWIGLRGSSPSQTIMAGAVCEGCEAAIPGIPHSKECPSCGGELHVPVRVTANA